MARSITITFDGRSIEEEGVSVDGLVGALKSIQDALKLTVGHLGGHQPGQGQPPKWVREQSRLSVRSTRPGSLVAELQLVSTKRSDHPAGELGSRALDALIQWDGSENSTLPSFVIERLGEIHRSLPPSVEVWLGDAEFSRRVRVDRREPIKKLETANEAALLYGWLNAVNWDRGTAQLHRYRQKYVPLRFDSLMQEQMLTCATQFVEVTGTGKFNNKDQWQYVEVEEISAVGVSNEGFDLEAFLESTNPKVFDPEKIIRASEPFDMKDFMRFIDDVRDDRKG